MSCPEKTFQSTPSGGEGDKMKDVISYGGGVFQSTPSGGEGDALYSRVHWRRSMFQSTPSGGEGDDYQIDVGDKR